MKSELDTIAVVGAGLAGVRAVETLRREGFEGRIVWIGDEAHAPYDRLIKDIIRKPYGQRDAHTRGIRSTLKSLKHHIENSNAAQ